MSEVEWGRGLSRARAGEAIRGWGLGLADFLLPPTCLACGALVDTAQRLCGPCWRDLTFIADPACYICGFPLPHEDPEGPGHCAACIARRPNYDAARAALVYNDGSRSLILRFKHGDGTESADLFAMWISRRASDLIARAEVVIPVPLHRRRLWRRRYNQAGLVAARIARRAGKPFEPLILLRTRHTPPQGGLSRKQRFGNVRTAFSVKPRRRARIEGQRVLLVDDVMTTGATVESCARTLKRNGASAVDVVTVARVVSPRA